MSLTYFGILEMEGKIEERRKEIFQLCDLIQKKGSCLITTNFILLFLFDNLV